MHNLLISSLLMSKVQCTLRVHFFGRILKRICDLRSFGSWCIKGTDESLSRVDSSVPLMHHDPRILKQICDLRSFGSWCIKGTDESLSRVDSSVPLMHHDPNDLRSQIRFRILSPKEMHPKVNFILF